MRRLHFRFRYIERFLIGFLRIVYYRWLGYRKKKNSHLFFNNIETKKKFYKTYNIFRYICIGGRDGGDPPFPSSTAILSKRTKNIYDHRYTQILFAVLRTNYAPVSLTDTLYQVNLKFRNRKRRN